MLVSDTQIDKSTLTFGQKGKRLGELQKSGFNVPKFSIISAETIEEILNDDDFDMSSLCSQIISDIPATSFAVRSAALIEDGKNSSQAGQFKTVLNVSADKLIDSIISVIKDAKLKLSKSDKFSLVIQEYIQPDWAGVIFSRNPLGKREMVIEYNQGNGESVVGGKSSLRIDLFPHEADLHKKSLPKIKELVNLAKEIEAIYKWPQDIEWAIKDEVLYLLQTRPITGFSSALWQGLQFLDKNLSESDHYFYDQTSLTETFYQPKTLSFSILEKLYQKNGPIDLVYKKIGVSYQETSQFKIFGNQLFVDREAEIKSIFPAFSYVKSQSLRPKIVNFSKLIVTISNNLALQFVSLKPSIQLREKINHLLNSEIKPSSSVTEVWEFITTNYQIIFEINLRSQKALEKLTNLLGKDKNMLAIILTSGQKKEKLKQSLVGSGGESLLGNSINLDDISPFQFNQSNPVDKAVDKLFTNWWDNLPKWKQFGLQSHVDTVREYMELRELGRLASVKMISLLRIKVEEIAQAKFPDNPELIYFATLDEILTDKLDDNFCRARSVSYQDNQFLLFPRQIASFTLNQSEKVSNTGLSAGFGEGILVTTDDLDRVSGKKILYTQTLSPELTKYFGKIEGIISSEGGLLSHLAIMAREVGLPVVISRKHFPIGKEVKIDGVTGEIVELD